MGFLPVIMYASVLCRHDQPCHPGLHKCNYIKSLITKQYNLLLEWTCTLMIQKLNYTMKKQNVKVVHFYKNNCLLDNKIINDSKQTRMSSFVDYNTTSTLKITCFGKSKNHFVKSSQTLLVARSWWTSKGLFMQFEEITRSLAYHKCRTCF